ncbi:MAG: ABC transporter permease [Actinobacteria bacterium]|nr:ABC transporter permease [Actinomycetota bacterium]
MTALSTEHIPAPSGTAGFGVTAKAIAVRTARKILRSPQILGIAIVQSIVFLLMFRYILGGAIGITGVDYVDFLVPGFVISGMLFTAGGSAVAVAEEAAGGLYDRLRSLPVSDWAVLAGRGIADAFLLVVVALVTTGVGFLVGFRMDTSPGDVALALVLLCVYALVVACVFVWLGLVAGNAQAAQGLSILGVPFSFISSAFVPIATMPGWIQWFAEAQPLTFWINSWRGLLLGDPVVQSFEHDLSYYIVGGLLWAVVLLAVFSPLALRAYRKR